MPIASCSGRYSDECSQGEREQFRFTEIGFRQSRHFCTFSRTIGRRSIARVANADFRDVIVRRDSGRRILSRQRISDYKELCSKFFNNFLFFSKNFANRTGLPGQLLDMRSRYRTLSGCGTRGFLRTIDLSRGHTVHVLVAAYGAWRLCRPAA